MPATEEIGSHPSGSLGHDAFISVPNVTASPRRAGHVVSLRDASGNRLNVKSTSDCRFPTELYTDVNRIYFTDCYREWEQVYLRRLAKRIHRLVCSELDSVDESLFMLFLRSDKNLDGKVAGDEAVQLRDAIEEALPGMISQNKSAGGLCGEAGAISFVSLLNWFEKSRSLMSSPTVFNISSLTVGLIGSGALESDARLDGLSRQDLQRHIKGYRSILWQVRMRLDEKEVVHARKQELDSGLTVAMQSYYKALTRDFEADSARLFELFSEVDVSGNLRLDVDEVRRFFAMLDPSASAEELSRYTAEVDLSEGPLTFASLLEWWDQARSVPNSLVAEKGVSLSKSVNLRASQRTLGGLFESSVQKQWKAAKDKHRLQALRQAYICTLTQVRDYKLDRDLRRAEVECAEL
eukprot:TRINITY_DN14780_c0_g1_i1.p1 TRINITY_DN14780_c0_g1~~TRINITY_DN14780_c0_g1_i1.p1  ORF type:complete len:429 (-),score=53.63 TRINITY_DN14780_c0_g1_i1:61-1284(-)